MDHQGTQKPLVQSYLTLRTAVGIIGFVLPFVLIVGKILLQGPGIEPSISDYYYTDMRNELVGSLCAIGVFLMSIKGYDPWDKFAGYFACLSAIGVAFFPTTPPNATGRTELIGYLHYSFAALLFLTFAIFCLCLFTKTDLTRTPTPQKLKRNWVYRICGSIILICIVLIFIVKRAAFGDVVAPYSPVFWLESIAVVTFGVAWLTRGEMILKDEKSEGSAAEYTAAAGRSV